MAAIVHFDIGADNLIRAKKFYEDLFGWKITATGKFTNYYAIETTGSGSDKSIGGGLTKREPGQLPGIINYIGVASIDETIGKAIALGGKIKFRNAIPGYGYTALCTDTENNPFGLFQEDKNAV